MWLKKRAGKIKENPALNKQVVSRGIKRLTMKQKIDKVTTLVGPTNKVLLRRAFLNHKKRARRGNDHPALKI